MVCVHLVVIAGIGGIYRRARRPGFRQALAVRERLDLKRGEVDDVNLAVVAQVFGFRFADAGDVDGLAVGRPIEAALGPAVIVLATGDLARRAAERRQ